MMSAGGMKNLFGNIQIIVIIIAALGMLVMVAGRSGVTLTKFVDGSIIKDGVINWKYTSRIKRNQKYEKLSCF